MSRIEVYPSRSLLRSQKWWWRLVVNGKKVAGSLEGYTAKAECERMAVRVVHGKYADDGTLRLVEVQR